MTPSTARYPASKRRVFSLLTGAALILTAAAIWQLGGSHDPFGELELNDDESHHGSEPGNTSLLPAGKSPEEQLRLIDEQLRADPNNAALLSSKIHLGLEYAPAVAAQECRRILEKSPGNYFALHHAAMAYLAMTNLDRALHFASKALQTRDTVEARFVAGHVFYAKGDFPSALKHYRAILSKNPNDPAAGAFVEKVERASAARHETTKRARVNMASPN